MVDLPVFSLLAFASAAFFGLDPILSKRGLEAGGLWIESTVVALVTRLALFWGALLVASGGTDVFAGVTPYAAAVFVGAAVVASAGGRLSFYVGVDRAGSTVSNAVTNLRPLFTVALAAVWLGEAVTLRRGVGVLLLVAGLVVLSLSRGGDIRGWNRVDLLFPLFTALAYGVGNVVRRFGFTTTPLTALQAIAIGETAAVAVVLVYAFRRHDPDLGAASRGAYLYFCGGGVFAGLGLLAMFGALNRGPVSIVDPITALAPFLTVVFALVLLRDVERVTRGLVVGTALIVVGVALIP